MGEDTRRMSGWQQSQMFPPEQERIRCEIIIDRRRDIVTYHVRRIDEISGALTAAWSLPLRRSETLEEDYGTVIHELGKLLREAIHPF